MIKTYQLADRKTDMIKKDQLADRKTDMIKTDQLADRKTRHDENRPTDRQKDR
jgi:hypothetical protein